jgi:polar amino acid transport system substrate-binding protein
MEAIEKDGADKSFADMLTYDTYLQAFTDLEVGRIDAVVVDEVVAKYHMEKNPDKFKLLDEDFGSEQYGIAAKKGNTELIDKLQTALDELNADGEAAEISTKWFGEDIVVK